MENGYWYVFFLYDIWIIDYGIFLDRTKVEELKKHARVDGRIDFLSTCPKCYDQILTLIDGLSFEATPPYVEMQKLLDTVRFYILFYD